MGNLFTVPHILILLLIIVLLFGRGKISDFMGDFAKGIKSFKKGLKDDEDEENNDTNTIEGEKVAPQKPKEIAARKTTTASTRKPRQTAAAKTASKTTTRKASTSKKKS